ncbi:MAG: hypothetical protein ACRETD_13220, partial [Steroidobacteraceae bacterium]
MAIRTPTGAKRTTNASGPASSLPAAIQNPTEAERTARKTKRAFGARRDEVRSTARPEGPWRPIPADSGRIVPRADPSREFAEKPGQGLR